MRNDIIRRNRYHLHAFTLIELLVVISIISLLSSSILTAISDARNKARIAANKQFEQSIRSSISDCSVAFYNFQASSTSKVLEAGGTGPDGVISGNPSRVESIQGYGQAMKFDGSGSVVKTQSADLLSGSSYTITAWVHVGGVGDSSWNRFVSYDSQETSGTGQTTLRWDEDDDKRGFVAGGTVADATKDIDTGKWTFLVGTFNGSMAKYFEDGNLVASSSGTTVMSGRHKLSMGARSDNTSDHIDGKIDNVRIYDCAFAES